MKFKHFLVFIVWFIVLLSAVIFLVNLLIYATTSSYIYKNVADVPKAQTAIILGAGIYSDGTLSSILKNRVDKAIELYKEKKISKILVSGDNSTIEHNEVNPVRNYLLRKGIPSEDIFLDHAGFDTYSTMYRARDIFKVSSVIIATQSFHLPRAVFIARNLGMEAYGIRADERNVHIKNYIREIFANEKAVFDLVFHTKPKFLGKAIPIEN